MKNIIVEIKSLMNGWTNEMKGRCKVIPQKVSQETSRRE